MRLLCACCLVAFPSGGLASVVLNNATTTVTVNGGEANNGLGAPGGYFDYFDKARNDTTTWSVDPVLIGRGGVTVLSNGVLSSPTLVGDAAMSTANFRGIDVTATTRLIGQTARTRFDFTSNESLEGCFFVFYADNDINGISDEAVFTGSIYYNDLRLFQFDDTSQSFFVQMEQEPNTNVLLDSFGSGTRTGFGTALEAGQYWSVLSADGSNFATTGDLGLALQWEMSTAPFATITVDYATTSIIPEPSQVGVLASGKMLLRRRRRRAV